jgi:hypothetical protein
MTRSAIYATVFEGLLLKEVSPSFYHVVDTPLAIRLLPIGGWQVVYYDYGKWAPCFSEPRASLELAARDAFLALATTRSMAMKLPILPHPALEMIGGVPVDAGKYFSDPGAVVIRPSAQDRVQSLVKPMERPATLLPALMDEKRMIDIVAVELARLGPRIEKEWDLKFLQQLLLNGLRSGRPEFARNAVRAADRGDEFAHSALRIVYFEREGGAFPGRGPWHVHIKQYGMRAVVHPDAPRRSPRGRRWVENWVRNYHVCRFVVWTCDKFGLHPRRNRFAHRADRAPSGISVVVAALDQAKIWYTTEAYVQEHVWGGLAGEIVREDLEFRKGTNISTIA